MEGTRYVISIVLKLTLKLFSQVLTFVIAVSLLVFLEKPLKWLPVKQNHGQFTTTLTQLVCLSLNCRFSCMHVHVMTFSTPKLATTKACCVEDARDWGKNSTRANAKGSKLGREEFLFSLVAFFSCSVTSPGHKRNRKKKARGLCFFRSALWTPGWNYSCRWEFIRAS